MLRFLAKLLVVLALATSVGVAIILSFSDDRIYTVAEWMSLGRFHRYDMMIEDAARKHGVDPLLIKAIVWRESEFRADKTGASGERGLMQVSMAAANDWVKAHKVETFQPADLFQPMMNLEIGTWYLKKALTRWASKDDPVPFALAEYNAGHTAVERWVAQTRQGADTTAADLLAHIGFPSTQSYIKSITKRRAFYEAEIKRSGK